MLEINQRYITYLVAIVIAVLCIWIAVTGRLGSLLGAFIAPGFMLQGTPPGQGGTETSDPNVVLINSSTPLTMMQIGAFAYNAGVISQSALATAIAIAMAESGGKLTAHNPGSATDREDSYGLWQINILAHPNFNKAQLYTASYNATAMYQVSGGGINWNPWGTYTSGKYKPFLSQAQTAAAQVIKANAGK